MCVCVSICLVVLHCVSRTNVASPPPTLPLSLSVPHSPLFVSLSLSLSLYLFLPIITVIFNLLLLWYVSNSFCIHVSHSCPTSYTTNKVHIHIHVHVHIPLVLCVCVCEWLLLIGLLVEAIIDQFISFYGQVSIVRFPPPEAAAATNESHCVDMVSVVLTTTHQYNGLH